MGGIDETVDGGAGAAKDSAGPHAALRNGERVGRYTIRQRIGEGGFAVVYLAEQTEPVRRQVALKFVKLGMDTRAVIARFEAERQALAVMDHPNVARVFDAGSTEAGRPYFVMEYVPGDPITDYCDRHCLALRGRLELFIQACDAVQHAHQKGIIHRDIKPSNVLVSLKEGEPQVKVIDFGVAKAISQRLTEKTIFTERGQLIGTPEYMSPEQAEMGALDVDTRTDVYALGVLLYELLVNALPFDSAELRRAGYAEIQRVIREVEPPRPSARLSGLGEAVGDVPRKHDTDLKTLMRELRGDLDWIAMKALEKDRTRRYATASELAADARRHLAGDPVHARKPSLGYVVGKLLSKERGKVAAALLVLAALFLGAALLAWRMEATHWDELVGARALARIEVELARREEQACLDLRWNPPPTLDALLADPCTAFVLEAHRRPDMTQSDVQLLGSILGAGGAGDERVRAWASALDQPAWRRAVFEFADDGLWLLRKRARQSTEYKYMRPVNDEAARLLARSEGGSAPSTTHGVELSSWSVADLIARGDKLEGLRHAIARREGPGLWVALAAVAALLLLAVANMRSRSRWHAALLVLIYAVFFWSYVLQPFSVGRVLFAVFLSVQLLTSVARQWWDVMRISIYVLGLFVLLWLAKGLAGADALDRPPWSWIFGVASTLWFVLFILLLVRTVRRSWGDARRPSAAVSWPGAEPRGRAAAEA